MQRVCFLLKVKPERLQEYAARHEAVWPEMLEALRPTSVWRRSRKSSTWTRPTAADGA